MLSAGAFLGVVASASLGVGAGVVALVVSTSQPSSVRPPSPVVTSAPAPAATPVVAVQAPGQP
jgi:hypothetical protein